MHILINAANVRFGGGVTVAKNIIKSLLDHGDPRDSYCLLLPKIEGYSFETLPNLTVRYVPDTFHFNYWNKAKFIRFGFSRLVEDEKAALVLSLGNVAFPCKVPQLLLIQNAYLFYPESVLWRRLPFKFKLYVKLANKQTAFYLKYADKYLVQTSVMKERLHRLFQIKRENIDILPNVVSYQSQPKIEPLDVNSAADSGIRLLFLSKYYPHKNYDILIPLARIIKNRGIKISISLTVMPEEHPYLMWLKDEVYREELDAIIKFIGTVRPDEMHSVFETHTGSILPTLLESFSGTYIESMYYGRPIFTSDLDFAHVVCSDAAYYFDPLDPESVFQSILSAFADPEIMHQKIKRGFEIVQSLPKWIDLAKSVKYTIESMNAERF
jgi:glycosyltransferase involved in cell wall biosynthesis